MIMKQEWIKVELPVIPGDRVKELYAMVIVKNDNTKSLLLYVPATFQFLNIDAELIEEDGKYYINNTTFKPDVNEVTVQQVMDNNDTLNKQKLDSIMGTLDTPEDKPIEESKVEEVRELPLEEAKPADNRNLIDQKMDSLNASSNKRRSDIKDNNKPFFAKGNKQSDQHEEKRELPKFFHKNNNEKQNKNNSNNQNKPKYNNNQNKPKPEPTTFGSNW